MAKNIIAINDNRDHPIITHIINTLTSGHNIDESNIKCCGDQFKTLGEIICLDSFKLGPSPSILERNIKIQTVTMTWKRRDYHGNLCGRSLTASTYLHTLL